MRFFGGSLLAGAALLIGATMLAQVAPVQPAHACVWSATPLYLEDGRRATRREEARWQREQARRNAPLFRARRAALRSEAEAGLADPARDYATSIANSLIPPVREVVRQSDSCGRSDAEHDPAGQSEHWDDERDQQEIAQLVGHNERRMPSSSEQRMLRYAGSRCNIEFRYLIANDLRERINRPLLGRLWGRLHEMGYDFGPPDAANNPRQSRLFRFVEGRSGPLRYQNWATASWARGPERLPEAELPRVRRNRAALEALLTRDAQTLPVIRAMEVSIGERQAAGSRLDQLCPATASELREAIREERAQRATRR